MAQHEKLIQIFTNLVGRADAEVREMILAANLPVVVDFRTVRGYRCNERRTPAPKQSWLARLWSCLWGQPAPADTVLYEHHLEGMLVWHPQDHAVVVNNSKNPDVEVGWTIRLVGEDWRDVVAEARVSHREENRWTTVYPAPLTRKIGRLSEPLVSIAYLLPEEWAKAANYKKSDGTPRIFVSEAQEVLLAKVAELEAASAPKARRKYHCPTCENAMGEACGVDDGPFGKYCCPTCARHGGDMCGCGRSDAK